MRMRPHWRAPACALASMLTCLPAAARAQAAPSPQPAPPAAQPAPAAKPGAAEQLPAVTVVETPEKKPVKRKGSAKKKTAEAPASGAGAQQVSATAGTPQLSPLAATTQALDTARDHLLTQIGTSTYPMNRETLEALPEGTNAPLSKALLQAPGVTQDSAASGQIHVRNEHANVQYRVNGIILPDGVSGFSQVLDTAFIGSMALVTGALPAEYGLHTSGLIDIQTRSGAFDGGGSISLYGGQRETFTPSFEYGGTEGKPSTS